MSGYALFFIRPEGKPSDRHDLQGAALEEAKISAAILYAGASFMDEPPTAYIILSPGGEVVYRFPEPGGKVRADAPA